MKSFKERIEELYEEDYLQFRDIVKEMFADDWKHEP